MVRGHSASLPCLQCNSVYAILQSPYYIEELFYIGAWLGYMPEANTRVIRT